ncbi:sulfite exporter TauE/SafE family protein [Roseiarcaceae bacterium H3SJ34-1]|uniref:sulfite exporter TauE/SafE family protein n=1 Tax=Terripilifer ovatus TaxID=3032367 RepID=UPI003AB97140|nr:sulfite exporter TauE/SafE family protein [Roseiarcaceae bacterium H3SJ34-1]
MEIYLPIAEMPVDVFLILGMGVAVGFISGMFGVGGGFLLTPLLIFVGIPPAVVVATQGPQIAASSMTGALAYWRRKAIDFKLGGVLLAGGLIGTLLGVLFFNQMRRIGQLETVITISYVVLLGGVGTLVSWESLRAVAMAHKGPVKRRRAGRHAWYEGLPLKWRFQRSGLYISVIPILFIAALIGFAGAVLGIGGGFILVPALIYIFRVPAQIVVGTSLFQILFTMLAATVLHASTNHSVDLFLALILMVGGVFGAQFGARTGAQIRSDYFRVLLGLLILSVAVRFATDVLTTPKEPFSATLTETVR